MPRPKTSLTKARLTGELRNHRGRFQDRSSLRNDEPIGEPKEFMGDKEKAAWRDFAASWPWLTMPDRAALTALCMMRAKIEDPAVEKTASMHSTYRLMLADFGGTPVSRARIEWGDEEYDESNPFAQFEN